VDTPDPRRVPDPRPPGSGDERAEDLRVLKGMLFWLSLWAFAGLLFLILAIWVDWV